MPGQTALEEIKHVITTQGQNLSILDYYVIGLLLFEQKYIRGQRQLASSPHHPFARSTSNTTLLRRIESLRHHTDKGFYHTIQLMDALISEHPLAIKRMLHTLLSLDKMGRYLLSEHPLLKEDAGFSLASMLNKLNVDTSTLCEHAQYRTLHMTYIHPTFHFTPTSPQQEHPSSSTNRRPSDDMLHRKLELLTQYIEKITHIRTIYEKIKTENLRFSLLSKNETHDEAPILINVWHHLFLQAKLQDSSRIDELYWENHPNEHKPNPFTGSAVALLHETLQTWLLLSLLFSAETNTFKNRVETIIKTFKYALQMKQHPCSAYMNVEINLLIQQFTSFLLTTPGLNHHPLFHSHRHSLKKIQQRTIQHAKHHQILSNLTHQEFHQQLKTIYNLFSQEDTAPSAITLKIALGKIACNYFKPELSLNPQALPEIPLETMDLLPELHVINELQHQLKTYNLKSFLAQILLTIIPKNSPPVEKLFHMHASLSMPATFIIYQKKTFYPHRYRVEQGAKALHYIEQQVKLVHKLFYTGLSTYDQRIKAWCQEILNDQALRVSIEPPSFKRRVSFFNQPKSLPISLNAHQSSSKNQPEEEKLGVEQASKLS